jgi:translation initiation factor 1
MNRRPGDDSRLVYSTDGGRAKLPPEPKPRQAPKQATPSVPADGVVRVMRTKSGRGGKTVTLVTGLPGSPAELEKVLKTLKSQCGTGGAVEGRNLAIQGDQRERVVAMLEKAGHTVKLAGG